MLKYLPRVFVSSSNPHGKTDAFKAFSNELEEDLRADKEYSEKWTLRGFMRVCEGLIIKWQKAHYNEVVRGGKRKETEADSDKSKRQRAGSSSVIVKAGEYCEGCGKPRHKRETCQLTGHPDYNEKGQWIHSEGYKLKKAWNEANGRRNKKEEGSADGKLHKALRCRWLER